MTHMKPQVLTGEHFINGDEACAEGAIAAGCRFFGGYPFFLTSELIMGVKYGFMKPALTSLRYFKLTNLPDPAEQTGGHHGKPGRNVSVPDHQLRLHL